MKENYTDASQICNIIIGLAASLRLEQVGFR